MESALLTDEDIFGSTPLLSDADIFGADAIRRSEPETGGVLSSAGNIAAGIGERIGDLGGGLVRSVAGMAESAGDWLERRVPLGAIDIGRDGVRWRPQTEEEIAAPSNVTTLGQKAARALEGVDFGYEPGTSWEDVKASPLKTFIPFAIEQGLISAPDAAAAIAALPVYIAARTGEMGQERAQNDGVDNARVEDLLKVLPSAVASSMMERLGAKGMFGLDDAVGGVASRAAKAGVKEAGTEAAQESVEYAGTHLGTEKGFDPAEMGERAVAGAVAGGTFGAAVGGTTAAGEKALGAGAKPQAGTGPDSGALLTDGDIFGAEQAPPAQDTERLGSPRLTPEDRASPIPNDILDDGKALLDEITRKEPSSAATLTTPTAEERATLRKAGSADDEIDAMSVDERQADIAQAKQAGVLLSDAEIFSAGRYQHSAEIMAAREAQDVAPPLSRASEAGAGIRTLPESSLTERSDVGVARAAAIRLPAAENVRPAVARRDVAADVAVTASGREVPVKYAVVEASSLIPSQRDEGGANPDYPAELQPRDRERASSQLQIQNIAASPNPRLLDRSPRASDGAPIIAADGVVESGNGRVLGLRRAYASGKADGYRQYLAEQGYPVEGMTAPVLVRVREAELNPADRLAFTREANERDTLAMSATEQAMADASSMSDNLLTLYRGGDVDAAANRDFVRAFVRDVVGVNDHARMIGADGSMSQEAVRRVQAGLLAKAYGDADLVSALVESTDTNIKAIGGALMDVSAGWAQMRAEARDSTINPAVDLTAQLLEAVRIVQRARSEGKTVLELVGQVDMFFGQGPSPEAIGFLQLMFRNRQSWTQPAGREKLAGALQFYTTEARKTSASTDLLGESPVEPTKILKESGRRQYERTDQQEVLFDRKPAAAPAAGQDDRSRVGDRTGEAEPRRDAQDSDAVARSGDSQTREVDAGGADGAYRIRESAPGGIEVELTLSRELVSKAADVADDLRARLDKMGLRDVGVRVSETITAIMGGERFAADGSYFKKVIDVALDARNTHATLDHEAIHALRRLDLFSDNEWAILARKSKNDWIERYDIEGRYAGVPEWAMVEEGIAHAYADWSRGVQVSGIIARSFKRIKAFLEALKNALSGLGFKTSETIFEEVGYGKIGSRPRDQFGRFADPAFSLAERTNTVDEQGIPRLTAVTRPLGQRIMQTIKRGKDDGESLSDYTHRKLIDYLQPVKVMIEKAGGAPQETMDAYLQARLAEDTALARIQKIHDQHVTPMVEELAKGGVTLEDLHRYAYAMHAEERNRIVGLRNEQDSDFYKAVLDPSIKGASGWSTNEARRVLREFQSDPTKQGAIARAYRHLREMIDQSLLDQKRAGLISAETYDILTSQWQHYVPLRSEESEGSSLPGRGFGFDVRGKEFQGATGRATEADNITVWAIASAERAVLRAEKNAVGKAMLRFINHADPKGETLAKVYWSDDAPLMEIEKAAPVYRRELKDGKVVNKKVPPATISPDMFAAKIGGKNYYIEFADEKVGLALKKLGQAEIGAVSRLVRNVTVWQSIINTRANPAFVPVNILRDAMTGSIHLLDEGFSVAESTKILGNVPKAWGALWRNARGKTGSGGWDQALREYIANGGKITFENNRTLEDSVNLLRKRYAEALHGKSSPKAMWDAFANFWGDLNDAGENGMRLSAYVAARGKGMSAKRAAFLGRDLTVDFKKHGEVGPAMNSWYVFFNASVQGNYNVAKRLATSRKVRVAAAAIIAQGVLMDMLNRALSGEDDDGESYYSKLVRTQGYKLERQMVLFYGPGEADYFTLPLPYGYNALYHLGVQAGAVASGDVDVGEALANSARVTFDAYNPLGSGGSLLNLAAPTILDPFVEVATNTNFFGGDIAPAKFPGDYRPDSQTHFSSTPDVFRHIAQGINAATGGNDVEPGMIDYSPDVYEHLWDFVSGGIGRFFGQLYETGEKTVTGRAAELEPENIPWVRSFFGRMDDDDKRAEYYRQREEVQAAKQELKEYRDSGRGGDAKAFVERNPVQFRSISAFDAAEKQLRKIRKAKRAIDLSTELSRAEKDEKLAPLKKAEIEIMNGSRRVYARERARLQETRP